MSADRRLSFDTAHRAALLSNGRYTVMLTAAGSGFSRWVESALTRWREDPTCDDWGSYVLLRDGGSGTVWSACRQPCGGGEDAHPVTLGEGRAEFVRRDGTLTTTMEVAVAADRDAEVRRVTIANDGGVARDIALTSYAELVLGAAAADAAHPAFSKLFVETSAVAERQVLLATRRRRSPEEPEIWAAHCVELVGRGDDDFEFETDRARFIGRGRTLRSARAMQDDDRLSNTAGAVLDPVFSLRVRVSVAAHASVRVCFWTVCAGSRDAAIALCESARAPGADDEVFAGAVEHARTQRARFGVDGGRVKSAAPPPAASAPSTPDHVAAITPRHLLGALLYADSSWRSPPLALARGTGGAPVLWAAGISGDRPIVSMRITGEPGLAVVDRWLAAQLHWQWQRYAVDLVLCNDAAGRDAESLQAMLEARAAAQRARFSAGNDVTQIGVFVLRGDTMSQVLRDGLATAARIVLDASADASGLAVSPAADSAIAPAATAAPATTTAPVAIAAPTAITGTVAIDTNAAGTSPAAAVSRVPALARRAARRNATAPRDPAPLHFANGTGRFDTGAREYAITLDGNRCTPAPWVNVVANPSFGFMVSAEGGGYTWSVNSQQNPLTPWPNDPVCDAPHEVLYLRDDDSGELWSATALPMRVPSATYTVRHGKGYSRFAHEAHEIAVELLQCVPQVDSVKLSRLRIGNRSQRVRRLSITAYVEWALGANGTVSAPFVVTSIDAVTGALFAGNAWRAEFGERIAFADMGGTQGSWTADRGEFLGSYGATDAPAALAGNGPLSGRVGAGLDPCGALQSRIELAPGSEIEIVFALGEAESQAEAQALVAKYRAADVDAIARDAKSRWDAMLDTMQVRTPDPSMDILLNDWLLYQALGCRVWARTAYYQSSGAYGFRDQLQDVMALCVAAPAVAREHLLRAASRQFTEGDVQHWWLPPAGQGLRTRMTDDRIWLPYVLLHYLGVTGDVAALDESVPFIEGAALEVGQLEAYFNPAVTTDRASLYEHCARALDVSLALGAHGLPLIGTGDWNDGMNRVGALGRGESVWLAWFLLATIDGFAPHARARGENARAERWLRCAASVRAALETAGWDGKWYRRGYYDDGTPLGSHESIECSIDAIAQSWSAMSGVADPDHAAMAMDSLERLLISDDDRIALLLTPPFDRTPHDPGYIKGYPPGIRENGGQYTHGATWSIFAFAALGQGDRAARLFDILNPIHHSSTPDAVSRYKVEPYVACADVYSVAPHVGRGGWTWYTGSAAWLYRAGIEAILGLRVQDDTLAIDPCLPAAWPGYDAVYLRRGDSAIVTRYEIAVENPRHVHRGVTVAELDGVAITRGVARIPLSHDGLTHRVRIELG